MLVKKHGALLCRTCTHAGGWCPAPACLRKRQRVRRRKKLAKGSRSEDVARAREACGSCVHVGNVRHAD